MSEKENKEELDENVDVSTEEKEEKTNIELYNEKRKVVLKTDREIPEKKKEPEPEPPKKTDEEYKTEIETLAKELVQLRVFKANRLKEIDDFEARLKAQLTKEDQKLKGFKDEKKSEVTETVIPPLYKKMTFDGLTETSKKMRKK